MDVFPTCKAPACFRRVGADRVPGFVPIKGAVGVTIQPPAIHNCEFRQGSDV